MKAVVVVLVALILLVGASAVHADDPENCDLEQRTIKGNANSPCQWDYHLDEIISMGYVVLEHPDNDTCYEALEFSPSNFDRDFGPNLDMISVGAQSDGQPSSSWPLIGRIANADRRHGVDLIYVASGDGQALWVRHEHNTINQQSAYYGLATPIGTVSRFIPTGNRGGPFFKLAVPIQRWPHKFSDQQTKWFRLPAEVNDFNSMMNDCVHDVRLRLETEATQETLRQQLAGEELEKQQALAAEKAQVEMDAMRLESAKAQLVVVQEQELIKTRALKARLERDRVIVGIIQAIALERIRGAEDRTGITHAYLKEIKANYADFDVKVQARYDELQRLEALNQTIADAIVAHDAAIQVNLERAEALEEQNRQKLEELIGAELTPLPETVTSEIPDPDEIDKLTSLVEQGLLTQEQFDLLMRELARQ